MIDQLPARALFNFELPIHYLAKTPLIDGDVSKWGAKYMVPPLCEIDGEDPFADVYWAWNEDYLFVAFDVFDHAGGLQCDTGAWWKKDGFRVCVNTRDTRDIRRATRFCRFFYFLPSGGGRKRLDPVVGTHRMSRAKEPPAEIDLSLIKVGVRNKRRGYSLEAAIPAACMTGWDPVEHPRIGIFFKVKDVRLGAQNLSVPDDLGWNGDPSTWATGVLTR